ncbi:15777_t:CDS:1, partial [Gigaspora rosea]
MFLHTDEFSLTKESFLVLDKEPSLLSIYNSEPLDNDEILDNNEPLNIDEPFDDYEPLDDNEPFDDDG